MSSEEDAQELYSKLLEELRSMRSRDSLTERDDFLTPIEAEIAHGKSVKIKLKVPSDAIVDDPVAGTRQSGGVRSGEFVQRQEFSAMEKLEVLVTGLELATTAPPLMAQSFIDTIKRLGKDVSVDHVSMAEDQAQKEVRKISFHEVNETVERTKKFRELISEVKVWLQEQREQVYKQKDR